VEGRGISFRLSEGDRSLCKRLLFSAKCPDRLWDPPGLLFSEYRGSFLGVKRPESELNPQSPASSAEIKNEWSYASAPPICLHGRGQGQLCLFQILPAASRSSLPSTHSWLSGMLSLEVKLPELESDIQLYSLASLTLCGTNLHCPIQLRGIASTFFFPFMFSTAVLLWNNGMMRHRHTF
jgi:hypothetical protein